MPASIMNDDDNNSDLSQSYWATVWLVNMTMFTVGYGDVIPQTKMGKILTIMVAFWGAFLISMSVVTVTNIFQLNESQLKANKDILHSQSATKVVSLSLKFFL